MTGPDAGTVIAMEVFIEKNRISPEGIFLEFVRASIERTSAIFVTEKNMSQPARQFRRHLV
jgi:hypothetical protein